MRCIPVLALFVLSLLPDTIQAQERCKVVSAGFEHGRTVPVSVSMPNDGKGCKIAKFTFQGGSEVTYSVVTPPSNGRVFIRENEAYYVPNKGFSGTDKYLLDASGTSPFAKPISRSGRFEVTVTVAAP